MNNVHELKPTRKREKERKKREPFKSEETFFSTESPIHQTRKWNSHSLQCFVSNSYSALKLLGNHRYEYIIQYVNFQVSSLNKKPPSSLLLKPPSLHYYSSYYQSNSPDYVLRYGSIRSKSDGSLYNSIFPVSFYPSISIICTCAPSQLLCFRHSPLFTPDMHTFIVQPDRRLLKNMKKKQKQNNFQ